MRLGAYEARLAGGSKIAEIYGDTEISERHRHRYEVNIDYKDRLEECGLVFAGMSPDGVLPETVEYPDHPWFIGVQYHPELKSRPFEPHPLFASFIGAAMEQSGWWQPEIFIDWIIAKRQSTSFVSTSCGIATLVNGGR
jgi:CTP synthase